MVDKAVRKISECNQADLVVLPEIWNVGFMDFDSYVPQAEEKGGPCMTALRQAAREAGVYLHTGSFVEQDGDKYYNSSYLLSPEGEILAKAVREHRQLFFNSMDDDFNSGGAIGALFALIRDLNQYFATKAEAVLDAQPLADARDLLEDANTILNLFPGGLRACTAGEPAVPAEIAALVAAREEARYQRDWARADSLRDEIQAAGFLLEDGPQGTRVRRA